MKFHAAYSLCFDDAYECTLNKDFMLLSSGNNGMVSILIAQMTNLAALYDECQRWLFFRNFLLGKYEYNFYELSYETYKG